MLKNADMGLRDRGQAAFSRIARLRTLDPVEHLDVGEEIRWRLAAELVGV
jgi:hypothetical protein